MQDNALQNNPLAFFAGLVLFFVGLLVALFYLIVRTATESTILPVQHFRLKHFILALVVAAAGVVLPSFARPRGTAIPDRTGSNHQGGEHPACRRSPIRPSPARS